MRVSATAPSARRLRSGASGPPRRGAGSPGRAAGKSRRAAGDVANNPWGERALRFGIGARGFVFLVLAYLVARIATGALGSGGTHNSASSSGVAQTLAQQPGGPIVLVLLGVGLICFALFCLVLAVREPGGDSALKRWAARAAEVWRAAVYGAFGGYCFAKAFGGTSGGTSGHTDRQQTQWSAQVLRWPAGWLWLGLLAAGLFVAAGIQLRRAVKRRFTDDLKEHEMGRRTRPTVTVLGVVGYLGRTGAYALVGWFVLHAALEDDPDKGKGVDGSARMLAASTGGPALLWLLAIAVGVFGLYLFAEARYRRF
jgi:hypothetical protein